MTCPVSLVTNWESEINKKWIGEARIRQRGIDVIAVRRIAAPHPIPSPPGWMATLGTRYARNSSKDLP